MKQGRLLPAPEQNERGAVLIILILSITAVTIFLFGILQYLHGVQQGLRNLYLTVQATQAMQSQFPHGDASLQAAAWVLRADGVPEVAPREGAQRLPGDGYVNFSIDSSTSPPTATVTVERTISLLGGSFEIAPGIGLKPFRTRASLSVTSEPTFISLMIDTSRSMTGEAEITKLLTHAGYSIDDSRANLCRPIAVNSGNCSGIVANFDPSNENDKRQCCELLRSTLPFYLANRAQPTGQAGLPGFHLCNPMDPKAEHDPDSCPQAPLGQAPGGEPFAYTRVSNPGLYSRYRDANWLTDHPEYNNPLVCGDFSQQLPYRDDEAYFLANPPGMRTIAFDHLTADRGPYGELLIAGEENDPQDRWGANLIGQNFCSLAWFPNTTFMTPEEINACQGVSNGPELPWSRGCLTQYSALHVASTSTWITYIHLVQHFAIQLSQIYGSFQFAVFSGPTVGGEVNELEDSRDGSRRISGVVQLFPEPGETLGGRTMYERPIDTAEVTKLPVITSTGTKYFNRNLISNLVPYRLSKIQAMLDGKGPLGGLNRELPSGETTGELSYRVSSLFDPIPHPRSDWQVAPPAIDESDYPGLCLRMGWEKNSSPPSHPSDSKTLYQIPKSLTRTFGLHWLPKGAEMNYLNSTYHDSWLGAYDFPSLLAVEPRGPTAGRQVPQNQYSPQEVNDYAPCLFSQLRSSLGGTDTWGAFEAAQRAGEAFQRRNPGSPRVYLFVTDGKPNLQCDPAIVSSLATDEAGNPLFSCPSNPTTFSDHMQAIENELAAIESSAIDGTTNSLVVLLYIQHVGAPLVDAERDRFLDLFRPNSATNRNPQRRMLFTLPVSRTSSFESQFRNALSIINATIKGAPVYRLPQ